MRYGRDAELTPAMVDDATDGFSPCPSPVVEILKSWVIRSKKGGTLFDNCAGDGVAAHSLAQAWGLRPVLVEPHRGRHSLCLRYDSYALCAPAQRVAGRGPTVWFFNPPYDLEDDTCSMERHLLWSAAAKVPAPQTLCIWLIPWRIVNDPFFADLLDRYLTEVRILRLPQRWDDYRQVAVMGYWTNGGERSAASNRPRPEIFVSELPPLDRSDRPYSVKAVGMNFSANVETLATSQRACLEYPNIQVS